MTCAVGDLDERKSSIKHRHYDAQVDMLTLLI
jgi:hypothetical protein